jgi:uncharacterized membrane protein
MPETRPARETTRSFGDRVADRVTAWGGSWTFIFFTIVAIGIWMMVNVRLSKAFDPYPYILLNLVLACMTVLQAPLIMMSQNRQAERDRLDAQHDYEVNTRAELEIAALKARFDVLQEGQWQELMREQQRQLQLLTDLATRLPAVDAD